MHKLVFTLLYYIQTLKTPTCFDPCGITIRKYVKDDKLVTYSIIGYVLFYTRSFDSFCICL